MYETVTGVDIGTSKISAVVGQRVDDGMLEIKGIGTRPSRGVNRGFVVNLEATTSAMLEAIEDAETQAGLDAENVFISIAGSHISGQLEQGLVTISNPEKEIRQEDLERVVDQAQRFKMSADRRILHVLPVEFTVDGQRGIENPVMMTGVRLEALAHIITGGATPISNLARCIEECDIDARDIVYSGLASGDACLNEDEKRLGVLLIDIGAGKTDLSFFRGGQLRWMTTLPVGGQNVTRDLAIGVQTSDSVAETLKCSVGAARASQASAAEIVEIPGVAGRKPRNTTRLEIAQYIEPRMQQIFQHIGIELDHAGIRDQIGAGMVVTGGGALLEQTVELGEAILRLPGRLGKPQVQSAIQDKLNDPRWVGAVGLALFGLDATPDDEAAPMRGYRKSSDGVMRRVRDFFRAIVE